jgi:immunoglobulin-binding protein 1
MFPRKRGQLFGKMPESGDRSDRMDTSQNATIETQLFSTPRPLVGDSPSPTAICVTNSHPLSSSRSPDPHNWPIVEFRDENRLLSISETIPMNFTAGILPIAEFRAAEDSYIELLKQSPALPATAESAASLMQTLNTLWDFFRRGHFYSDNEELEELSTNTVRFFLIPYYIGRLHLLFQGESRPAHLEAAAAILTSFSEQMTHFAVIGENKPIPTDPSDRRSRMIADYQEKKVLEDRIQSVNGRSTRDDLQRGFLGDPIDEETERDLVWNVLKLCAMEARSLIRNSVEELPFAKMRAAGVKPEEPQGPPPKMWVQKIEREDQRKRVFAPLEDVMPQPLPPDDETWAKPDVPGPKRGVSDDEEDELARKEEARWDDYKDDHPPFSEM